MKILITGASGFLGSYLFNKLNKNNTLIGLSGQKTDTQLIHCDITQKEQVIKIVQEQNTKIIIHCAGISRNFYNNPTYGKLVNIAGTQNIVDAAKIIQASLVYISSASVFNGQNGSFTEKDKPKTNDEYGKTKIEAENIIHKYKFRYLILRPSLIIGNSPKGAEETYLGKIIKAGSEKKKLKLDNNWIFAPSWNWHIEKVIQWWLQNNSTVNLLHVTSRDTITKMEFARKLYERLNIDQDLIQKIVNSKNSGNNILNSNKLKEIGAPVITIDNILSGIAAEQGFEPQYHPPEGRVLPLDDSAIA